MMRTLTISDLEKQAVERLKALDPSLDASVYGSHIINLIRSAAYGIHPVTLIAEDILRDGFPQTASGTALDDYHGGLVSSPRIAASGATGKLCIYGEVGQAVPLGTKFTFDATGIQTTTAATITGRTTPIDFVTTGAGIATIQCAGEHGLPVGGTVLIAINSGGELVEGLRTITGVTQTAFTIGITDQGVYGFGVGMVSSNSALVPAQTTSLGVGFNVLGSVQLSGSFAAFTDYAGLTGAADAESNDAYAARIIKLRGLLEGVFTADQVELAALRVAGNTRAWVVSPKAGITGGTEGVAGYKPQAGQVCVYFVRDADPNIYPNVGNINTTKQSIIDYGILPANTDPSDLFVFSPIELRLNIGISNLVPDTPQMRLAIESALRGYIADFIGFESAFTTDQMRAVIAFARDATGARPESFVLSNASVPAASGTLTVFDGVTWS
jgi:uncharacterized phage protein gp47/JayE